MMRAESKSNVKNNVGKVTFVALSLLIQIVWIVLMVIELNAYSTELSLISTILALAIVLLLYGKHTNAAFKMPWIMLILAFPFMGLSLYLLIGNSNGTRGMRKRFEKIDKELDEELKQKPEVFAQLEQEDLAIANQSRYIWKYSRYPVHKNTDVKFYYNASEAFEEQLRMLETAKHFIFMEYHAIEDAESFARLKDVLAKKAKEGVEVRIFYDEIGSIGFINRDFIKRMEKEGIECRVFNPVMPILNMFMNNRDHRKITVIDGIIGFTGGYNLANEYFNITHPYGHWKDTGIKLMGDGVKSLTAMFLEMWNSIAKTDFNYKQYLPEVPYTANETGYVQPYGDSPLDDEYVGENVYLNMIKNAKRYIYFMTPYLVITDEMNRELGLAAKRGVDVRIITPGIPDKRIVYQTTRSYYAGLARQGVRIFEYTPGFCHAKQCVSDDHTAIIGTINMDFRSLYFHFENAVFLYNCKAVMEIWQDFAYTFKVCREVTADYNKKRKPFLRLGQCILRLIAPML